MGPIIGITANFNYETKEYFINQAYVDSIVNAGGFPVMLTPTTDIPTFLHGILMSGGSDIDPVYYHEDIMPECGQITPIRDQYELILAQFALESYIPILGICRGLQVLNVAAGGTLYQDIHAQIGSKLQHFQKAPKDHGTQRIQLDGVLKDIYKRNEIVVNTMHHQSVKTSGTGFKIVADASDGIIKAIEHKDHKFALGVQWHPECMKDQDVLFKHFVNMASEYSKK